MTEKNLPNITVDLKSLAKGKELLKEFEAMRNMAELKALSNVSLERKLTDTEFKRIMELKDKCLKIEVEA